MVYIFISIIDSTKILTVNKVFACIFTSIFICAYLYFTPTLVLNLMDAIVAPFSRRFLYKKLDKISKETVMPEKAPVVAMCFPVMNDFMPDQILQSSIQSYQHIKKYILDDSTNQQIVEQIDEFAKKHNFIVLRKGQ
jgi:hypothetical protein